MKNQLVQLTKLAQQNTWQKRLASIAWLFGTNQQPLQVAEELRLPCPACQTLMEKVRSRTNKMLFYDYCSKCRGSWLDAGESERLAAALRKEPGLNS